MIRWVSVGMVLFATSSAWAEAPTDVSVSSELPAGVAAKGGEKIERVVSWKTGKGAEVAVFTSKEASKTRGDLTWWTKSLLVTTYTSSGAAWKKVREVKEVVPPCDLDMTARFFHPMAGSEVTDLDGDGVAELTFGYVTRCAGDVSPMSMKVIVLEGKDKHILRGDSKVDVGNGEIVGGTFKADFGKKTEALRAHAEQFWNANVGP